MGTKILVVDDEYQNLSDLISKCFKAQIRDQRYTFFFARDGEEAWEKISLLIPDLMLLDLKMPRLDGFALLQRLHENHINIKTIIVSAYSGFENVRRAMQEKAVDFLAKPVEREDLTKTIEKVIALKVPSSNWEIKKPPIDMGNNKVHLGTVMRLANELTPYQTYKLASFLIEKFTSEQIETLQEELPGLKLLAQEEEETKAKEETEDERRIKEGKIPFALLKLGYIEERVQKYRKSTTGEEITYQYLFLRWLDPHTNRLRGRAIKKKDLEEPLVRQMIEEKLGKPLKNS